MFAIPAAQTTHAFVTRLPVHTALIKDDRQRKTATCNNLQKSERGLTSSSQNLANLGFVQQLRVPRFMNSCSYAPESRLFEPGWLSCPSPTRKLSTLMSPDDPPPILRPRRYFPALRIRKTIMVAQDHEILQAFKATLNFLCLLWLEEPAVDSRRMQRQDTRIIRMAILGHP